MGQPLTPPVYGNDCGNCTPAAWPAGLTPLKMQAFFEGIVECPLAGGIPPPNGTCTVEQDAILNCTFRDPSGNFNWTAGPINTFIEFAGIGGEYYIERFGVLCANSGNNDNAVCGGAGILGILGTVKMSMEPIETVPWLLCDSYNFVPTDETWFNQWLLDSPFPPNKVVGLYNTKYRANVLVRYEP